MLGSVKNDFCESVGSVLQRNKNKNPKQNNLFILNNKNLLCFTTLKVNKKYSIKPYIYYNYYLINYCCHGNQKLLLLEKLKLDLSGCF